MCSGQHQQAPAGKRTTAGARCHLSVQNVFKPHLHSLSGKYYRLFRSLLAEFHVAGVELQIQE
jgi:hypothetical protein